MFCFFFFFCLYCFFFFFKQKTAYEMLRSLVGSEMCIRDSSVARGSFQRMGTSYADRSGPVALLERRAQSQHGGGVHLGDPGLGHPEHPADLRQGHALVVVEDQQELLALAQALYGLSL